MPFVAQGESRVAQLDRPKPKGAPNLRSTFVTMVETTDTRPGYYLASAGAVLSTFRSLLPEATVGAVLVVQVDNLVRVGMIGLGILFAVMFVLTIAMWHVAK